MNNNTFNILIVEDEAIVAADLAARLNSNGYNVVDIANNYEDAIVLFKQYAPDLVLLDITIKGNKNGIDIANTINALISTPFIFITAHVDAETIENAKKTFPAAYLIKPFTTSHLLVSIDLAIHNFAYQKKAIPNAAEPQEELEDLYSKQDFLFIKEGYVFIKIHQKDILYLEAQDNYVRIHTTGKHYLIRCTLTKAMNRLNKSFMLRVHRSFGININHIESFSENEITIGFTTVPIGRNYKTDFMQFFEIK